MLTPENVNQIFRELVNEREPEVIDQSAEFVTFSTAKKRASLLGRDPLIVDAIWSFWSWCWPGLPQNSRYTEFIRTARSYLFYEDLEEHEVEEHARRFFQPEFLQLDLNDCAIIVNTANILDEQKPGRRIHMFDESMLPENILPRLRGYIYI